jgi:membrane protein DedA with SNARE-associated domain
MIEHFIDFIVSNLLPFGVLGVFLASVLEEVVAPIPSALVMMMSGFIFVTGDLSFTNILTLVLKVALPASLGVTIGSYAIFFASKYGGKALIHGWGRYIGLYWSDLEKMEKKLAEGKKQEIIIGLSRVMPFIPSVAISAFCGFINMNIYRYFIITLCGTFIRGIVLGAIGWQVGNIYQKYAEVISSIESSIMVALIVGVIVFVLYRFVNINKGAPQI